jgi:MSHA biogenesis protein MshQ
MLAQKLLGSTAVGGIEFVGSSQANQGRTGTSFTVPLPSGVEAGDLLIAFMVADADQTWTGDTGWTEVADQGVAPSTRIAYKVAASGESNPTFVGSANNIYSAAIVAFRGAAYDTIGSISTAVSSGVQTAPQISLAENRSTILAFFARGAGPASWSNPSTGLTLTETFTSSRPSFALYRQQNLPSGNTGTRSATISSSTGALAAVLVGIKPA